MAGSMIEIENSGDSIVLKTPSSRNQVGDVISTFSDFLLEKGISGYSVNRAIIVLRELLINAIEHGNRHNKAFPVTIGIDQLNESKVKISVKDLGCGFDHSHLDTAIPDNPKRMHSRGFRLVNAVTDSFEFNREGNEVTAYISTN